MKSALFLSCYPVKYNLRMYFDFFRLAQEAETPSSLPTFINLPPPYSEQPSPMYNLCASSISSNYSHLNHCCHHHAQYQHLCFKPSPEEKSVDNKATVEVPETEEDTNSTTDTTTSAF